MYYFLKTFYEHLSWRKQQLASWMTASIADVDYISQQLTNKSKY